MVIKKNVEPLIIDISDDIYNYYQYMEISFFEKKKIKICLTAFGNMEIY